MTAGGVALSRPAERVAVGWWLIAAALAALALIPLSVAWRLGTDLGHGWGAPLLVAYLYWERWDARPSARPVAASAGWWIVAVLLLAVALPLRLLLTPFPLWPAALTAYIAVLATVALGAAWRGAGWAGVRWVGGPLLVFLGTLPWPGQLEQRLIFPLREGMATIAAELSNLIGHPALAAGTSVRLGSGWVGIDEACGGIRSLQAAVMAALFLGEWLALNWARRIGLVLGGAGAAVLGNFLRVLFLVWRADDGEQALHAAHDPAGWLALGVTLCLTGLVAWRMKPRGAAAAVSKSPIQLPVSSSSPAVNRAALAWAGTIVAVLLVGELGTRWWYARGDAVRRASVPQWTAHLPEHLSTYRAMPLAAEAAEMLRPDFYASAGWMGSDRRQRGAYYIEWRSGQVARFIPFLHNPTVCLPMSGCELVREVGEVRVPWEHGEIPFHVYIFRAMSEEFAVAFTVWDPMRGQPLQKMDEGGAAWWASQWNDVREARQHQPAQLLTLAVYGDGGETLIASDLAALISARKNE